MPKPNQQPIEAGVFHAGSVYAFEALRCRGLGSAALREMQRNGLPSRECGRQKFVLGEDLIEHLRNLPPVTLPAKQ